MSTVCQEAILSELAACPAGASDVESDSDSSSKGPIIGGVGEQNAPCNPARSPSACTPLQTCVRLCSARHVPFACPAQLALGRSLPRWSASASTAS